MTARRPLRNGNKDASYVNMASISSSLSEPASTTKTDSPATELSSPLSPASMDDAAATAAADRRSIALLLVLYTLQGIPLGLAGTLPYLVAEKSANFDAQATLSLMSLPFSFKLLWSPLPDSLFSTKYGRRKQWLVPVQYGIAFLLLSSSHWVDRAMEGDIDIKPLALLFFTLYFLASVQGLLFNIS